MNELKKLCEPIVKYLEKNHNPNYAVIINIDTVKLVSTEISMPASQQND